MKDRKRETFEPVTLGHIRGHGWRDLLVYCNSIRCNHQTTMNAEHRPATAARDPREASFRHGLIGRDIVGLVCGLARAFIA
jgi:hypothetical protein